MRGLLNFLLAIKKKIEVEIKLRPTFKDYISKIKILVFIYKN